jgi:hypothetical protein
VEIVTSSELERMANACAFAASAEPPESQNWTRHAPFADITAVLTTQYFNTIQKT